MVTLPMVAALSDNGALPDPLGLLDGHLDALARGVEGTHGIGREVEDDVACNIRQPPDVVDAGNQPRVRSLETKMHKGFRAHVLDMDDGAREGTAAELDPLRTDADAAVAGRLGARKAKDLAEYLDAA